MPDVSGLWLGTYWQEGNPTRFEATLVQGGNALSGRILDDGYLGEAQIDGEVVGRSIRFTKRYLAQSQHIISYSGTLSEDANSMQGTWRIGLFHSGQWEAHRNNDDLMQSLKTVLEKKVPVVTSS